MAARIDRLHQALDLGAMSEAPASSVPHTCSRVLPGIVRCIGEIIDRPDAVVSRFAEGASRNVRQTHPDMLMMAGGDTALAILQALRVAVLVPSGEIEAGMPWFQIRLQDGQALFCAVKSGGFGNADSLLKLIPENLLMQIGTGKPVTDNTFGEKHDAPSTGETGPAPKAERVKSVRLFDRIFDQLRERIRSGNYAADSRLPSEHELAAIMGVSRPVVRDALGRLREEGLVYSRQGAGTFVSAQATPAAHLAYSPVKTIADIQRCYEFCLTIEPQAAYFAAQRRDEAAIRKIAAALTDLREATSRQLHRTDADFVFHKCVTEAANNHYHTASIDALKPHIAVSMHLHGLSLMGPRLGLENVFQEHNAIYKAVADGRAEHAREAMRLHLEGSRNRLFEDRVLELSF